MKRLLVLAIAGILVAPAHGEAQQEPRLEGTLRATPSFTVVGDQVEFDASSFEGSSPYEKTYYWDFDGEDPVVDAVTSYPTTTFAYDRPGSYVVTVGVGTNSPSREYGTDSTVVDVIRRPAPVRPTAEIDIPRRSARSRYAIVLNCRPRCSARIVVQIGRRTARQLGIRRLKAERTVVARGRHTARFGFNPAFAQSKGVRVVRIRARVVATLPDGSKVRRDGLIRVRAR